VLGGLPVLVRRLLQPDQEQQEEQQRVKKPDVVLVKKYKRLCMGTPASIMEGMQFRR
jgi:hypothetical protein